MFKYGKTWCVSLDFSSHDSNQHAELLEMVDNETWRELLREIYPILDISLEHFDDILQAITSLDSVLESKIKIGKLYRKIFKATIRGTVTSGHPTRTTFGNTLRVILFYRYMFMKAGI
jgi:hypothetical protein